MIKMKKVFTAILLSLSAAFLAGCTNTQKTNSSVSSVPESSVVSSEIQGSQEKSDDEKSVSEKSADGKSADEKSTGEKSADEKSVDEKSDAESSEENSDEGSSEEEKSDAESSEEENSDEESSEEESIENEPLLSFKLQIDDVIYQLPFDSVELRDNGYYLTKDGEVEPQTYSRSLEWKNDYGNTIITQLWNPSDKKKEYNDCEVGSVEIKLGEKLDVVMPGGFVFDLDVTPDMIKEQYGEPESEHIYNDYVTLRYKVDLSQSVEFFVYTNEEYAKFSSVTIKNFS